MPWTSIFLWQLFLFRSTIEPQKGAVMSWCFLPLDIQKKESGFTLDLIRQERMKERMSDLPVEHLPWGPQNQIRPDISNLCKRDLVVVKNVND
jgi:hypothetical protein